MDEPQFKSDTRETSLLGLGWGKVWHNCPVISVLVEFVLPAFAGIAKIKVMEMILYMEMIQFKW